MNAGLTNLLYRIAARFRHVKFRNDIPLPRDHTSLSGYVEGLTYTSFVGQKGVDARPEFVIFLID